MSFHFQKISHSPKYLRAHASRAAYPSPSMVLGQNIKDYQLKTPPWSQETVTLKGRMVHSGSSLPC